METERLVLRPWRDEDAPSLYLYASDSSVGPIAGWPPHTSVEDSLGVIRSVLSAPETYAIVLKAADEAVGSIGLMTGDSVHSAEMKPGEMEIGYWIGVSYWGKGLVPEAVRCISERAFTELGASALWIGFYDGNGRSKRVAEKCGFSYHHTEEGKISPLGDARTEHFMKLDRKDWVGNQKSDF